METISGKQINIFKVKQKDICIEDMARGLSQISRYGGQSDGIINVANHSVVMAKYFYDRGEYLLAKYALFDDSEEYLLGGDLITPIKHSKPLAFYRKLSSKLKKIIYKKFNLDCDSPAIVKELDDKMKVLEARVVKRNSVLAKMDVDVDLVVKIKSAKKSEREFLSLYEKIQNRLDKQV